jgi:signal transduction histidine kinase
MACASCGGRRRQASSCQPAIAEHGKDGHFGISGMRERAGGVGGTLTIASAPGSGTAITLVVPGRIIYRTFKNE